MARLAREGSESELRDTVIQELVLGGSVDNLDFLDNWIRFHYDYRPEEEEVIRTPDRMWQDYRESGRFEGDCDDIATFYASILISLGYSVRFVAIRVGNDSEFSHVYLEVWDGNGWRALDPTVRLNTQYQIMERMEMPV